MKHVSFKRLKRDVLASGTLSFATCESGVNHNNQQKHFLALLEMLFLHEYLETLF
jgi:hypothetical protein